MCSFVLVMWFVFGTGDGTRPVPEFAYQWPAGFQLVLISLNKPDILINFSSKSVWIGIVFLFHSGDTRKVILPDCYLCKMQANNNIYKNISSIMSTLNLLKRKFIIIFQVKQRFLVRKVLRSVVFFTQPNAYIYLYMHMYKCMNVYVYIYIYC